MLQLKEHCLPTVTGLPLMPLQPVPWIGAYQVQASKADGNNP